MTQQDSLPGILERVDSILDVVATEGSLNLTGITNATGLPRTTVHRLLEQMVERRWILRIHNDYEVGVRPFQLGSVARQGHWFYRLARPHLETLRQRTRLIVHLGFLDGTDTLWWDRIGDTPLSVVPTVIGGRHPAYRTAAGKVLLAAEDPAYLDHHFPPELEHTSPESMQTRKELHSALESVRREGLATERGELYPHLGCVAAPVTARPTSTSDGHQTTASVSVCGPIERIESDETLANGVRTCAMGILAEIARSPRAPKD